MGTARKTRYGMQSDGERKGRMKAEHEQRKEDRKRMEK